MKIFSYIDVVLVIIFTLILLKSMALLGLILDKSHLVIKYSEAYSLAVPYWPFYITFITILLSFTFLFKGRLKLWFMFIINLIISLIFLVDIWYYRGFNDLPTLQLINQISNLGNMSENVTSVIHKIDIVFVADIPLLLAVILAWRKLYRQRPVSILLFCIFFIASSFSIASIPQKFDFLKKRYVDSKMVNYKLSPIGFHLYDIYNYHNESKPVSLSMDENDEINSWFKEKIEYLPDNKYKGIFKGKNLIHIDIESMESFVINQKVNGQEITPTLNKLLKNGIYFSNIHEQVNQGNSSDADLLVNTSVYPIRKNSTFFAYADTKYNSMPKLMQRLSYFTIALHPDEGSFWNWKPALTSIGFEKCVGLEQWIVEEEFFLGITDGSYLRQVEEYISKEKQPFYAFLPTQSSHSPFDIPEKYRYLKLEDYMAETTLGYYFQSAHYADKCIGEFIDKLEKDGLLDNTVIALCGDHAGITKYHPGEAEKIKPAQEWWNVSKKQIPFIIYQKDLKAEEFKVTGGQVDILPTVAYLMGVEEEEYNYTAMGRNLLKTKKNFAILADGEFVGDASSKEEQEHALKGLEIADIIIKSNYFKDYNNKYANR